jgi:phospholipase/lecithinase/hemolysin
VYPAQVNFQQNVTTTFQNVVHQGLQAARAQNGTNFATVNLANLFTAIEAAPAEWGYTNTARISFVLGTD